MVVENGKPHPIRVRFQDLIPPPQHITLHIVCDAVFTTQHQCLGLENGRVSRRDGASIYRLGVRAYISSY